MSPPLKFWFQLYNDLSIVVVKDCINSYNSEKQNYCVDNSEKRNYNKYIVRQKQTDPTEK